MFRILIAEDSRAFLTALRRLLNDREDWMVVAEVGDGWAAITKTEELWPDLVILDYMMPGLDGVTVAQQVHRSTPEAEVIILTQHDAAYTARRALAAGVRGYVVKSDAGRELLPAIEAVRERKTFVSSSLAGVFAGESGKPPMLKE